MCGFLEAVVVGQGLGGGFRQGAVLLAAPVWCALQGVLVAGVARLGFCDLGVFRVMGCVGLPLGVLGGNWRYAFNFALALGPQFFEPPAGAMRLLFP